MSGGSDWKARLAGLAPFLADPEIKEILVGDSGRTVVRTEREQREIDPSPFDAAGVRSVARKIAQLVGQPLSAKNPHVTGTLFGEIDVVLVGPPWALRGPVISLVRRAPRWSMPEELEARGVIDAQSVMLLRRVVSRGLSVVVAGPRGSARTALLTALASSFERSTRLAVIEPSPIADAPGERVTLSRQAGVGAALALGADAIMIDEPDAHGWIDLLRSGRVFIASIGARDAEHALQRVEAQILLERPGLSRQSVALLLDSALGAIVELGRTRDNEQVRVLRVAEPRMSAGVLELGVLSRPAGRGSLVIELAGSRIQRRLSDPDETGDLPPPAKQAEISSAPSVPVEPSSAPPPAAPSSVPAISLDREEMAFALRRAAQVTQRSSDVGSLDSQEPRRSSAPVGRLGRDELSEIRADQLVSQSFLLDVSGMPGVDLDEMVESALGQPMRRGSAISARELLASPDAARARGASSISAEPPPPRPRSSPIALPSSDAPSPQASRGFMSWSAQETTRPGEPEDKGAPNPKAAPVAGAGGDTNGFEVLGEPEISTRSALPSLQDVLPGTPAHVPDALRDRPPLVPAMESANEPAHAPQPAAEHARDHAPDAKPAVGAAEHGGQLEPAPDAKPEPRSEPKSEPKSGPVAPAHVPPPLRTPPATKLAEPASSGASADRPRPGDDKKKELHERIEARRVARERAPTEVSVRSRDPAAVVHVGTPAVGSRPPSEAVPRRVVPPRPPVSPPEATPQAPAPPPSERPEPTASGARRRVLEESRAEARRVPPVDIPLRAHAADPSEGKRGADASRGKDSVEPWPDPAETSGRFGPLPREISGVPAIPPEGRNDQTQSASADEMVPIKRELARPPLPPPLKPRPIRATAEDALPLSRPRVLKPQDPEPRPAPVEQKIFDDPSEPVAISWEEPSDSTVEATPGIRPGSAEVSSFEAEEEPTGESISGPEKLKPRVLPQARVLDAIDRPADDANATLDLSDEDIPSLTGSSNGKRPGAEVLSSASGAASFAPGFDVALTVDAPLSSDPDDTAAPPDASGPGRPPPKRRLRS